MGRSYTERQRERVACGECWEVLAVGSMSSHLMTRHGKVAAQRQRWTPQAVGGPRTYKMYFPAKGGLRRCPVEECSGALTIRTVMRVHFVHRHVHDTVVMLKEVNLPFPRCPRCDLQVTRKALNWHHLGTLQCKKGADWERRRLAELETQENAEQAFHAYGKPMEAVLEFRYLRRLLTATDDDWPVVAGNIRNARVSWGRLERVLGSEGADLKLSRSFNTAVTQQVLR